LILEKIEDIFRTSLGEIKKSYKNCKATQSKRLTAGLKCWKWLEKRKFESKLFFQATWKTPPQEKRI